MDYKSMVDGWVGGGLVDGSMMGDECMVDG